MWVCISPVRTLVVFHKQPLCRGLMKTSGARPPCYSRGGIMEKSTCVASRLRRCVWTGRRRLKSVSDSSFQGQKLFIVDMISVTASTCCAPWLFCLCIGCSICVYICFINTLKHYFWRWMWMILTAVITNLSLSHHLSIHLWIYLSPCLSIYQ